jgi:hypothetical protein
MIDYCFIVTSALFSLYTCYTIEERFNQTLKTLDIIREKVPHCYILFIDNSNQYVPKEYFDEIKKKANCVINYEHNLASSYYNSTCNKDLGEVLLLERALKEIKELKITPKRIFKISGRYMLNDNFDINYYNDAEDKFIGNVRAWEYTKENSNEKIHRYNFETSLWSFPFNELENIQSKLLVWSYNYMLETNSKIEQAFFDIIPKELIKIKNPIGVTLNTGYTGEIIEY